MNATTNPLQTSSILGAKIKPVILCGGSGTRLWPLSRESYPKQFVPLINGHSLLDLTLKRIKRFGSPIFVANEEHRFFVQDLLCQETDFSDSFILLEPAGRNTAAAMASAALISQIQSTDLLLFLPSDHFVPDIDMFFKTVESGIQAAENGYIVTFGVQPNFPSTAYGYIQKGNSINLSDLSKQESDCVYSVEKFIEKPLFEKAQDMFFSEKYLWNSGIFLCKADTLLIALAKHAPDILKSCQDAMKSIKADGKFIRPSAQEFLNCRSESIDYAVMEHFDKVAVCPFRGAWSDVGSWNAVAALGDADAQGNCINGQGHIFNASNTYINAPHRPVVALGTNDLVIIDTADAILVANHNMVEQVKEVVAKLKRTVHHKQ